MTDESGEPAAPDSDIPAPPEAGGPAAAGTIEIGHPLIGEVTDALELLDHATRIGFKSADGQTVGDDIRSSVLTVVARLNIGCKERQAGPCVTVPRTEWLAFLVAYQKLAALLHPVTAATLRATNEHDTRAVGAILGRSAALKFTRGLWLLTGLFAIVVVYAQWLDVVYGPPVAFNPKNNAPAPADGWNNWLLLVTTLVPFAYGGLGACVYLLRSAHSFIVERSFDPRRKPEYYNRIVLGVISGGTIMLFTQSLTDDKGQAVEVSSAALGFLAGYSTEFLFQTIERVIAAVLPRVGLESVRRATPLRTALDVPAGGLTLQELVDRHDKAGPDDKPMYKALIDKLGARL